MNILTAYIYIKKSIFFGSVIKYYFIDFVTFFNKRISLHENNWSACQLNHSGILLKLYLKNNNGAEFSTYSLFLKRLLIIPACLLEVMSRFEHPQWISASANADAAADILIYAHYPLMPNAHVDIRNNSDLFHAVRITFMTFTPQNTFVVWSHIFTHKFCLLQVLVISITINFKNRNNTAKNK